MRRPIRYQLLVPLLTLLLGVVGISTWTALASADRARHQIETQVRNVAHTLSDSPFPLHKTVLDRMKLLSGADFLLITPGRRAHGHAAGRDAWNCRRPRKWSRTGRRCAWGRASWPGERVYLGSGVRLPPRADIPDGATLYILYPEELWRSALWEAVRPSLFLGGFAGPGVAGAGRRRRRAFQPPRPPAGAADAPDRRRRLQPDAAARPRRRAARPGPVDQRDGRTAGPPSGDGAADRTAAAAGPGRRRPGPPAPQRPDRRPPGPATARPRVPRQRRRRGAGRRPARAGPAGDAPETLPRPGPHRSAAARAAVAADPGRRNDRPAGPPLQARPHRPALAAAGRGGD